MFGRWLYSIKIKYYNYKNYFYNCYALRNTLKNELITDLDDFLLSITDEAMDKAYELYDDDSISMSALEDLQIARHMIKELKSVKYNASKDQYIGMSKRTFEFIGRHMYRWWS